jgi:hypothetical protein
MSQNIVIGGSITLVNNNLRTVIALSDQFTTTGSNSISSNANIATGSWQVIDQGSDTNYRYGFFTNLDATSSVKLAINSAGTSSYAAWLQPGDVAIIPNIGSAVLYAQATGSHSPIILQYLLTES